MALVCASKQFLRASRRRARRCGSTTFARSYAILPTVSGKTSDLPLNSPLREGEVGFSFTGGYIALQNKVEAQRTLWSSSSRPEVFEVVDKQAKKHGYDVFTVLGGNAAASRKQFEHLQDLHKNALRKVLRKPERVAKDGKELDEEYLRVLEHVEKGAIKRLQEF